MLGDHMAHRVLLRRLFQVASDPVALGTLQDRFVSGFVFGKGPVVEIRRVFRVKRVPRVVATTHSWDATLALARAAAAEQDQDQDQDVMLVRLERGADPAGAVTYSGDELLTAARQGIEVR